MEMTEKSRAKQNFHESFAASPVKPPSARSTGLVFVGVAVIVAVLFRDNPVVVPIAIVVALCLLALSLTAPRLLEPLSSVWFAFGMLLSRVMNPVVMFLMFAIAMVSLADADRPRPAAVQTQFGCFDLLAGARSRRSQARLNEKSVLRHCQGQLEPVPGHRLGPFTIDRNGGGCRCSQ